MRPHTSALGTAVGTAVVGAAAATMSSRSQLFGEFPWRSAEADASSVALTFDDGPNEPWTARLLEVLHDRGVPATFFQVGTAVARDPDTTRAVVAAGHTVGNHSHWHEYRRCFSPRLVDDDLRRSQETLAEVLGIYPSLFRPPWLVRTPSTLRVARRHGLRPISGTFCHPLEVMGARPSRVARSAVARGEPGSMLIFHDGYNGRGADRSRTLDAVAATIDGLAAAGRTFVRVDQLLGVAAYH